MRCPQNMPVIKLFFLIFLARPCLCYRLFRSRDAVASSVIEACRTQTPNNEARCYAMLRCIMDNIPSDFTARWSAGSSILAFIPTIVGLMSNRINEISSLADESVLLSIALSVSSITAFNSRFGDRPTQMSDTFFEVRRGSPASLRTAEATLNDLVAQSRLSRPWWQSSRLQTYALSLVAIVLGAGVWYEVYQITIYGVVTFACPVQYNIAIWVALSQLLALLNVLCRSFLFDIRTVHLKARATGSRRHARAPPPDTNGCLIVLRCPRDTFLPWVLQTFSAIASFTLYAYGTVLLASVTLVPASDAIRAMVVFTASAGLGRLAGYWLTSPRRRGSKTIIVDVPADCLQDFTSLILEQAGATP